MTPDDCEIRVGLNRLIRELKGWPKAKLEAAHTHYAQSDHYVARIMVEAIEMELKRCRN